jgi:hypothetical protein
MRLVRVAFVIASLAPLGIVGCGGSGANEQPAEPTLTEESMDDMAAEMQKAAEEADSPDGATE